MNRIDELENKLASYYTQEENRKNAQQVAQSEEITIRGLWGKQHDVTRHFTRDFMPQPQTQKTGLLGKLVIVIKRFFRKGTMYIFEQFSALLYVFESKLMELIGMMIQFLASLDGRIGYVEESVEKQRQELKSIQERILRQEEETCELEKRFHQMQEETCRRELELQEKLQAKLDMLEQNISTAADAVQSTASALETEKEHVQRWQDDRDIKIKAMARDVIRTKWAFRDYVDSVQNVEDNIVQCSICGYSGEAAKLEKKTSECIFDGGKLVRYVCPECGGIFGPTKFSTLTKEAQDDDYTVHYTGYHEGDSTDKEIKTFMRLEPTKDGVYLNYGCGSWSQTMQKLHDLGYHVYGFEPYSRDINNPYIISDRTTLSKMRFNGIFSNDVLEHMTDPVSDISFMKSLLATPDALMAHTTGCYGYKYEYTRFHMSFFTGNSLNVLCEKAGLKLIEVSDAESEIGEQDFHCRLFGRKEPEIDYLPVARLNSFAEATASEICLHPDGVCFGPYITLPTGKYTLHLHVNGNAKQGKVPFSITADKGKTLIMGCDIPMGGRDVSFEILPYHRDVEFVLRNLTQEDICITKLALS